MGNSESNWRSQLSFICSLLLHAGAIAVIVLGPTMLESHFGNMGSKPQAVDMTIVTPPDAPAVKAPTVVIAKAPVVKPVVKAVKPIVRRVRIHRAPKVKQIASVVPAPVKKVVAPIEKTAPMQTPAPVKTVAATPVPPQPKIAAQSAARFATKNSVAKTATPAPSVAGTPTGSKTITVTQDYLSLRQMAGNQPPEYTRDMRLKHEQGVGQLVYFVNRDGTVSNVRLTKSTGFPELDQAAVQAFSKYRFVPGQEGYTVHNFEFVLNGPAMQDGPGLRTTMNN